MSHAITNSPPNRAEIDSAVRALIQKHGAAIMNGARRYSLSREDAEDAYQRGLEILLKKAPSTRENDLVPWLKTVVKHEAFAIREQRKRTLLVAEEQGLIDATAHEPSADLHAERLEQLRVGAEAMARLKPQEIRCLALKAEGFSYAEISEVTGWSRTKVNRSLTEGRSAFRRCVSGIETGAECKRLSPVLSRLADGEASAEDMRVLRPHLRGCLACRATLRDYRQAPNELAAVAPAGMVAGSDGIGLLGRLGEAVSSAKAELVALVARPGTMDGALAAASGKGGAGVIVGKGLAVLCIGGAAVGGACLQTGVIADPIDRKPREAVVEKAPSKAAQPAPRAGAAPVPSSPASPTSSEAPAATPSPEKHDPPPPPRAVRQEFGFERAGGHPSTSPPAEPAAEAPPPKSAGGDEFSFER